MDGEVIPIISDKKKQAGWTAKLVLAGSAAVVGSSFQFGYNMGVINAPGSIIQEFFNSTHYDRHGIYIETAMQKFLWGLAVPIFAIGGIIGSFIAGYAAGKLGRKYSMLFNNILVLAAVVFMGTSIEAQSYELLIIGRLIIGINCGINTTLAPLYLTEIAPVKLRGVFGTSNQLGIVTAMLISQILGVSHLLGTDGDWPLLMAMCGVFALYQLAVLPFCPETPSFLLSQGKEEQARSALLFLRGNIDIENEIMAEKGETENGQKISISQIFKRANLRRAMLVAIVLQLSQQLSGINAVFYYSTSLFEYANVPSHIADLLTVGMGVINIVMTYISLLLIERLGRRILMLIGLGGMFFCSIMLVVAMSFGGGTSWGSITAVTGVMLFVVTFQTGPGSIPWFMAAEFFSQDARTSAMSVASAVNWAGNFAVGLAYPPLQKSINGYAFVIFAILLAIFWLYTYFKVPETKGKSIEEITNHFKNQ